MTSVYICYFGVTEPLVQTQVISYLRELAKRGVDVVLLTFDRPPQPGASAGSIGQALKQNGIEWHSLSYHKATPGKLLDIVRGTLFLLRLLKKKRGLCVLHARSHVPAAMAMLAGFFRPTPMIFDIRGLMAEEYVDHGTWQTGSMPFRLIKWLERKAIRKAAQIVVLTEKMRDWLTREHGVIPARIQVIPCCVDTNLYHPHQAAVSNRVELIYAGSVSGLYLLPEMAKFFLALRVLAPSGAFFRILTTGDKAACEAQLEFAGLRPEDFAVQSASPAEIPGYLARATIGISFRKPTFAQIASSPTKIPEFLAAGIPVVCNSDVGDSDTLVKANQVGVVVSSFTPEAYAAAAAAILKMLADSSIRERCSRTAKTNFDLASVGGPRYFEVYGRIQLAEDVTRP